MWKKAVWLYMPNSKEHPYYCDECVPRGCSCNLEPKNGDWENPDEWIQPLDKLGREYPCIEFHRLTD